MSGVSSTAPRRLRRVRPAGSWYPYPKDPYDSMVVGCWFPLKGGRCGRLVANRPSPQEKAEYIPFRGPLAG